MILEELQANGIKGSYQYALMCLTGTLIPQ